jgi:glyoxalase family protein
MASSKELLWKTYLTGIEHATVVTANAEENLAFYAGVLGLAPVRQSAEPCVQHGHISYRAPDSRDPPILHFIVNKAAERAEIGVGPAKRLNLAVATYGVYEDSYMYWCDRLDAAGVSFEGNFDDPQIWFQDPDGLRLRILISYGTSDPDGSIDFTPGESVPSKYQLTRLHGVEFESPDPEASAYFMREAFGCELHDQRDVWYSKLIFNFCGGHFLHWRDPKERPVGEAGSIHHVALRCPLSELEALHDRLKQAGIAVEPILEHAEIGVRCFSLTEPGGAQLEVSAAVA